MTSDRLDQISRLYHAALARDSGERRAFLQQACTGDDALRLEVESLLGYENAAVHFIEAPALMGSVGGSAVLTGRQIATYIIGSLIDAGGMGEVYRAHDTRLRRDVAIKVLPAAFMADPARRARFEREARLLATLNHPNIAQIHGLEEADGVQALVMELVPGDTLAQLIGSQALPIDRALTIARQIAAAIEAAHDNGILHRDLKPANIKVTPDGIVKVLDFGLAKAFAHDPANATGDEAPATMPEGTREGMILGTAAYMSPEQARGLVVDKRADIWAFGCVLYEMLTGRRAFDGPTLTDTLAAVLEREPDWAALPARTPPAIRRLLRWCLQKDPRNRLHDMADGRLELADADRVESDADARRSSHDRVRLPWIVAGVLGIALCGTALIAIRQFVRADPVGSAVQFAMEAPPRSTYADQFDGFALSPDGRFLVFSVVADGSSASSLWLRRLDSASAVPLAGTQDAKTPIWSPDSRSLAFFSNGKLKRMAIAGGAPIDLCDATVAQTVPGGGSWNRDGVILFGSRTGVKRVSDSGGSPAAVTTANLDRGEIGHGYPQFLPNGDGFLYFIESGDSNVQGVYASSLRNPGDQKQILRTPGKAVYVEPRGTYPGVLLWVRDRTLVAQRYDPAARQVRGDPVPAADDVSVNIYNARPAFWASDAGLLASLSGSPPTKSLVWLSRDGTATQVAPEDAYWNLKLSRDASRMAVSRWEPASVSGRANLDIWVRTFARVDMTRLTFDPARDGLPVWSPDGTRLAFSSARDAGVAQIYVKELSAGPGQEKRLTEGPNYKMALDWSGDGKHILYIEAGDLMALPVDGERKPFPVVQTPFGVATGAIAPDGRWIAYAGNDSGRYEIYVQAFPGNGAATRRVPISTGGGFTVRWRGDGRELYYQNLDGKLMAAVVRPAPDGIQADSPRELFPSSARMLPPHGQFDVTPDGQRFLMMLPSATREPLRLTVTSNWQAGLRAIP